MLRKFFGVRSYQKAHHCCVTWWAFFVKTGVVAEFSRDYLMNDCVPVSGRVLLCRVRDSHL